MGFIEQFFKDKKEIKPEDIEFFISQKIEEHMNLDYKDIKAYQDADDLANHVSSFANSDGGLIVLGVSQNEIKDENGKTTKIYPKKATWGKVSLDKESLEQKLITRIKPPINGLIIKPIRNEKDEVIFLIDIPKSGLAPHMSFDNKYHSRTNFGTRAMEHYEVANLFRINWTMKEKLVEKIYEPLCSVLEKHSEQLAKHSCPFSRDVEEILSKTYYKMQMPSELLEKIDYYIDRINDLDKKAHYTRRALNNIVNKNALEHLRKEYPPSNNEALSLDFKAVAKSKSQIDLHQHLIYRLLLTNQKIQTYLNREYYQQVFEKIRITYSNEAYDVNLDEFDERIWKKCLNEASENTEIIQMKENAEALLEEVWDLIEEITRY